MVKFSESLILVSLSLIDDLYQILSYVDFDFYPSCLEIILYTVDDQIFKLSNLSKGVYSHISNRKNRQKLNIVKTSSPSSNLCGFFIVILSGSSGSKKNIFTKLGQDGKLNIGHHLLTYKKQKNE